MVAKLNKTTGPAKAKLDKLAHKAINKVEGRVGWFESEKYPDGTPIAYVAAVQEFGDPTNNIPPRPILRSTKAKKQKDWQALAGQGAKAIINGGETITTVMEKITLKAAGDARETITKLYSPPLKESTIIARARRRGIKFENVDSLPTTLKKPLVDTKKLLPTLIGIVIKK